MSVNARSTKLIRGLNTQKATGFQSRQVAPHDSPPVTSHYAPFAAYKKAGDRACRDGGYRPARVSLRRHHRLYEQPLPGRVRDCCPGALAPSYPTRYPLVCSLTTLLG